MKDVRYLCEKRSRKLKEAAPPPLLRWKSTVAVMLQLRDYETFICVIWGFKKRFIVFMTCYTGQVFLLGLRLGRSEDWSSVCGCAHARTGFRMASQTQTFNSSSPSHQWGNLLRTVTRCQSGRSIRNCFWTELETDLIIIFGLNRTETSLNWIIELTFGLELEFKVLYFYFHIEFICLNVIGNACGPLWFGCKLKVFSYL